MDAWTIPPAFEMPESEPLPLRRVPRLASWDRADRPSQVRLREYLDATEALVGSRLDGLAGPFTLRLDVGIPQTTPLLVAHDLDNYLLPVVTRLSAHGRFVAVWATKQHADQSFIRIEPATPTRWPSDFDSEYQVRTTASSQHAEFKRQIDDQLDGAGVLPAGGIALRMAIVVGPVRNWLNLWKPSIDALGRLLGRGRRNPWELCDGRIVELGMYCRVDPGLGNDVVITIGASAIRPTSGS